MLHTMTLRCDQCGQENNPQYHFCGGCGAPLRRNPAQAVEVPPPKAAPVVSGPSFLGLADEPRNNLDYLLEDQPSTGHGRVYLVILLLILLGGAGTWYWWSGELPWQALGRLRSAVSGTPAPSVAPSTSAAPSATADGSPTASEPAASAASPEPPAAMAKKDETATAQETPVPASAPPAKATDERQAASEVSGSSTSPAEPATPTTAATPLVKKASPTPAKVAKAAPAKAQPATAPVSPGDKLVIDGERYLYGNGVRQDCDRAQKNLLTAARQANAKAYPLLGAMYATGHCVTRDLPTAYRWFARALHQDPGNARVQRDLEVLWNQMTPPERQAATRAQ